MELVESGWNRLAPPTDALSLKLAIEGALGSRGKDVKPYGEGNAAGKIVDRLASELTSGYSTNLL